MTIDDHSVKRAAIDDPDLKPLWDSMDGTHWKLGVVCQGRRKRRGWFCPWSLHTLGA
jgi:hypothetical protein